MNSIRKYKLTMNFQNIKFYTSIPLYLYTSIPLYLYTPIPLYPLMILRADNLVKKYKQRVVVNHVSIYVNQGEIVGLLGPNGAGKTTTFYMTVGLIKPNE